MRQVQSGQKLNALFIGAAIVVMLVTGSIMQWFRFFPVPWRTGATFVHDVFALAIFVVVSGHIVVALTHRDHCDRCSRDGSPKRGPPITPLAG